MWGINPKKVDAVEIITEADGTVVENDLKRCCHCGEYWITVPGSGKIRGKCFKCNDFLCGKPECLAQCTPLEQRLEEESKLAQLFHRIANGA